MVCQQALPAGSLRFRYSQVALLNDLELTRGRDFGTVLLGNALGRLGALFLRWQLGLLLLLQ